MASVFKAKNAGGAGGAGGAGSGLLPRLTGFGVFSRDQQHIMSRAARSYVAMVSGGAWLERWLENKKATVRWLFCFLNQQLRNFLAERAGQMCPTAKTLINQRLRR